MILREQGYKQACVATVSLLDDVGERLATIRIGEMPESGKQTIMDRVEREVRSLLDRQPKLDVVVVLDGAVDLRRHLLARFPFARHITLPRRRTHRGRSPRNSVRQRGRMCRVATLVLPPP